jgi:DNA polymerase-3 subunit epsilon
MLMLLGAAAVCALAAAVIVALAASAILADGKLLRIAAGALAVLSIAAVVGAGRILDEHFRALERLRGAIVVLAGSENAVPPKRQAGEDGLEIDRLYWALSGLAARYASERAAPDDRLQAVLGAISEGIVVVTEHGQVSLVNQAAMQALGKERVKVGTSVFAALERDSLTNAMDKADAAGRRVEARLETVEGESFDALVAGLGRHGGAVISFSAEALPEHAVEIFHDLALHDRPPEPGGVGDDVPLDRLPMLVADTETTGLDVTRERVISIGAVRLHGARIYPGHSIDRLINPGIPIPPRSTVIHGITDEMVVDARPFPEVYGELRDLLDGCVLVGHNIAFDIHGITDEMVVDARPFPEVYGELRDLLDGCVLVGHNIAFDRAMLRRECDLAGLEWPEPPLLDTLLLAGALDPKMTDLRLEGLAALFGVDIHGRHTALGDCLVTAEIFARMLPRLRDIGVVTLGDAKAHGERAKHLVRAQKESGW